jgi:hypothetical protein
MRGRSAPAVNRLFSSLIMRLVSLMAIGLCVSLNDGTLASTSPADSAKLTSIARTSRGPMNQSFTLVPGVVVDPVAGILYAMNPDGGIDAVDIPSGKVLWKATSAAKPLLVFDHRLVAQREGVAGRMCCRLSSSIRPTISLQPPGSVRQARPRRTGEPSMTASNTTNTSILGRAVISANFNPE